MSQKTQATILSELEKIVDSFVRIQHELVTEYSKEKDSSIKCEIEEDMKKISDVSQLTLTLWKQNKYAR